MNIAAAQQKLSDNASSGAPPNANAILELSSINRGLLHARVALVRTTESAPLSAHVAGMMLYNTATTNDVVPGIYYNDGTKWILLTPGFASNISYNPNTYVINYIDINGNPQTINLVQAVKANETQTALAYDGTSHQLTYTGENGTPVVLDLNKGAVTYDAATNILTYTDETGVATPVSLNNTGLTYDVSTAVLSYVNTLGVTQTVDLGDIVEANETMTTLGYNSTTNELTYTGENGTPVVLNLNEGAVTYDAASNVLTYTDEAGVATPVNLNNTDLTYDPATSILSYLNTLGVTQTVDLKDIVQANETLTTLGYNAATNELTYTGENGTPVVLNLNEGAVSYNAV
ncbi:hypothetical protein G5B30_02355, partial [Sphingobacterium sp. SGG-5]|uniref:hypothetical protein n=1 Tax=Sphingobacterium sp. SGG-5 TaxID=2710881 RepID=UPI0013F10946